MVDLHAGADNRLFRVHKTLLCDKVPYFHWHFSQKPAEGIKTFTNFPEYPPGAFDVVLHWVYTGTLPPIHNTTPSRSPKPTSKGGYIHSHSLAYKLKLPHLCDMMMDRMLKYEQENKYIASFDRIAACYKYSLKGSPMRKWAALTMVHIKKEGRSQYASKYWTPSDFDDLMHAFPELARNYQVVERKVERKADGTVPRPYELVRCRFHIHGEGELCYKDSL